MSEKKTCTQAEFRARVKSLVDLYEEKNEAKRIGAMKSPWWRLRAKVSRLHYWVMVFAFPIALLLWYVTGDFWKALAFLVYAEMFNFGGNFRGLTLHIENLIEWVIGKTI